MRIEVVRHFRFNQDLVLEPGIEGWCVGLSIGLLSHIRGCQGERPQVDASHEQARQFARRFDKSFERMHLRGWLPLHAWRQRIGQLQRDKGDFYAASRSIDAGPSTGWALMNLQRGLHGARRPGALYRPPGLGVWFEEHGHLADVNHVGVLVWDGQQAFVFEPNVGGLSFLWHRDAFDENLPTAVDEALIRQSLLCGPSVDGKTSRLVSLVRLADWPAFGL